MCAHRQNNLNLSYLTLLGRCFHEEYVVLGVDTGIGLPPPEGLKPLGHARGAVKPAFRPFPHLVSYELHHRISSAESHVECSMLNMNPLLQFLPMAPISSQSELGGSELLNEGNNIGPQGTVVPLNSMPHHT